MVQITFKSLLVDDFYLLLKWLNLQHIKKWWDSNIHWTEQLIDQKYKNYVLGFKNLKLKDRVIKKPIHAFIVCHNNIPIGYIQYYNKFDFPPEQGYELLDIPEDCAALDYYIGEIDYIGHGLGSKILNKFISEYIFDKFNNVVVDPESDNIPAIKSYEKAGFKIIKIVNEGKTTILLKENNKNIL